jgi:hypothetical protein
MNEELGNDTEKAAMAYFKDRSGKSACEGKAPKYLI